MSGVTIRWVRPAALAGTALLAVLASGAHAAQAVFFSSTTTHGGIVLNGSPSVLVGGYPMSRQGDEVACPLVCSETVDHDGGIITVGAPTVLVNGTPAAYTGITIVETCATSVLNGGSPTVLINN